MAHNPRVARLRHEHEKLINLSKRSDFITIKTVNVVPGWPPEEYVVTFTCKGIIAVNGAGEPESADFHQVAIKLSRNFPRDEPELLWLTPIWHPNIDHEEPRGVCTNNLQNWWAGKHLDDLVISLGEMVQYKHYHAAWEQPWPRDPEVAEWVRDVAEPRGLLSKSKPFDDRYLLREYKIRRGGGKKKPPKSQNTDTPPKRRIIFGKRKVIPPPEPPAPVVQPKIPAMAETLLMTDPLPPVATISELPLPAPIPEPAPFKTEASQKPLPAPNLEPAPFKTEASQAPLPAPIPEPAPSKTGFNHEPAPPRKKLKMSLGVLKVRCPNCGHENRLQAVPRQLVYFCGACGNTLIVK